jgi:hypothetical protein
LLTALIFSKFNNIILLIWEIIMSGRFTMLIEHDDYGYYGYCPELSGCQTQGDTYEEAEANLK